MSGGVIVAMGVVGALALFETVLPRIFATLRTWRRLVKAARVKERAQLPSANAVPADAAATPPSVVVSQSDSAKVDANNGETNNEAQRLWEDARGIKHNFVPDYMADRKYLAKVYDAARLGQLEAMVKLGDYAYRRGALVEAFYWAKLAEMKLENTLCEIRTQWMAEGCPGEYENAYAEFTEEQGVFARAVLRLQCEVDPQYARARLKELAERGVEEARLFLGE